MKSKLSKKSNIFITVFVFLFISVTKANAYSITKTFDLPSGKTIGAATIKETNTDSIRFRLSAVWPYGNGVDDFTRIKISCTYEKSTLMSERVISESSSITSYNYGTSKNLNAGSLVKFNLKGNNPLLSAYATVFLDYK